MHLTFNKSRKIEFQPEWSWWCTVCDGEVLLSKYVSVSNFQLSLNVKCRWVNKWNTCFNVNIASITFHIFSHWTEKVPWKDDLNKQFTANEIHENLLLSHFIFISKSKKIVSQFWTKKYLFYFWRVIWSVLIGLDPSFGLCPRIFKWMNRIWIDLNWCINFDVLFLGFGSFSEFAHCNRLGFVEVVSPIWTAPIRTSCHCNIARILIGWSKCYTFNWPSDGVNMSVGLTWFF